MKRHRFVKNVQLLAAPMDSLSFYFVAEVVARLGSLEEVQKLGGVWSAAAEEEGDSRILCTLLVIATGNYVFNCRPGGLLSLDEVKKLNLKHLRIKQINVLRNVVQLYSVFYRYGQRETVSLAELLAFANRYFTCGQRFCSFIEGDEFTRARLLPIVQTICDLNNVRTVRLMHFRLQKQELVLQLLQNANPEVLMLRNSWNDSNLRFMLSWWADRNIKEFHIHNMQIDLNMNLLKHIYQLWEDGFFATRSFHADLRAKVSDRKLTPMLGQPTGEGLDKEWRVEHPSRKTFQLSRFRVGDVRMRLTIA
uniref:FBA_2 domain-containing protein n=1 Tax=Steinernema glaseri TaxID=37863 RepID=A0A1I7Y6X9_9BILA